MGKNRNIPAVAKYYKLEGNKIILLKKKCPRCGRFMAEHENRYHCGYCSYTEFKWILFFGAGLGLLLV